MTVQAGGYVGFEGLFSPGRELRTECETGLEHSTKPTKPTKPTLLNPVEPGTRTY
jgi:hypothetical protein